MSSAIHGGSLGPARGDVNDTLKSCILLGYDSLELGFVRAVFVLTRGVWPVFGQQDRSGAGGGERDPPTNCEHQHQLLACVVRLGVGNWGESAATRNGNGYVRAYNHLLA